MVCLCKTLLDPLGDCQSPRCTEGTLAMSSSSGENRVLGAWIRKTTLLTDILSRYKSWPYHHHEQAVEIKAKVLAGPGGPWPDSSSARTKADCPVLTSANSQDPHLCFELLLPMCPLLLLPHCHYGLLHTGTSCLLVQL